MHIHKLNGEIYQFPALFEAVTISTELETKKTKEKKKKIKVGEISRTLGRGGAGNSKLSAKEYRNQMSNGKPITEISDAIRQEGERNIFTRNYDSIEIETHTSNPFNCLWKSESHLIAKP